MFDTSNENNSITDIATRVIENTDIDALYHDNNINKIINDIATSFLEKYDISLLDDFTC